MTSTEAAQMKTMKRRIKFGIWDTSRLAFWLQVNGPLRLGFNSSEEAAQEIHRQNKAGFVGLVVRKFEANSGE